MTFSDDQKNSRTKNVLKTPDRRKETKKTLETPKEKTFKTPKEKTLDTPKAKENPFETPEEKTLDTPRAKENYFETPEEKTLNKTQSSSSSDEVSEEETLPLENNSKKSIKRKLETDERLETALEELDQLKYEVRKLKKRIKKLEEDKKSTGNTVVEDFRGELMEVVEQKTTWQGAVDTLLNKLFCEEELRNKSISGKKTAKCGADGPRPPMDQDKLYKLIDIVCQKFPEAKKKGIIEKIQNVQKVLRRKQASRNN